MSGTTASTPASTSSGKAQKVTAIISALQSQGTQLSDDDLDAIQSKTDPLVPDDVIHIDSGSTHIHVSPKAAIA
jgi:hypothetical protein